MSRGQIGRQEDLFIGGEEQDGQHYPGQHHHHGEELDGQQHSLPFEHELVMTLTFGLVWTEIPSGVTWLTG